MLYSPQDDRENQYFCNRKNQSAMSEEEKKTDEEEKTIPRPEGYTIVKDSFMAWILVTIIITIISVDVAHRIFGRIGDWQFWVLTILSFILSWIISKWVSEVKVVLKITTTGLEQTRLSGSRLYPKYRLIKWEDMKRYNLHGRGRNNDFLICVRKGLNFRIYMPAVILFVKQKNNWENFNAFRNDFWGVAPEHDVHRAFFG